MKKVSKNVEKARKAVEPKPYVLQEAIPLFFARLNKVLLPLEKTYEFEILFSNNCSEDATLAEIFRLRETDKRVQVLTYSRNFGYQCSVTGACSTPEVMRSS